MQAAKLILFQYHPVLRADLRYRDALYPEFITVDIKNKSPRGFTGMNDGTALLDAINKDAFVMHYQPVIHLISGRLAGAEALIRWPQPDGTLLPPDMFIPLAEKMQVITSLTLLVVRKVFDDMEQWLCLHPEQYISINVSPPDLTSGELLNAIELRLAGSHVRPGQIVLELTERDFFEPRITAPIITRCHQAGYGVYIDDFGTGYSNLCYLQEMKADAIKIDKLFLRGSESMKIISCITELAASLSLSVIAEGIETPRQHSWLMKHSVESGQGWDGRRAFRL